MKNSFLLFLFLLSACDKQVEKNSGRNLMKEKAINAKENKNEKLLVSPWFQYYQKENPTFSPERFELKETAPISYSESSVPLLNRKGFNEIYEPFLIFNAGKTKYLDFDSYHWFVAADGFASFEADQQIVLADLKEKKAQQIAFFGPSYQVEDAYWKGDSVAVLLGNSYDKVPFMLRYNFKRNEVKTYKYQDTLKFDIPYSAARLERKGVRVD